VLTCRELVSRLTDLSCGDLAVAQQRESKRHLARCESCASYWRSYRTTVALAREAYSEPGAGCGEIPPKLARGILAAARSRGPSPLAWRLVHLLSGIAAGPLLAFYLR
jgi:anti-sigma factor RsiW